MYDANCSSAVFPCRADRSASDGWEQVDNRPTLISKAQDFLFCGFLIPF